MTVRDAVDAYLVDIRAERLLSADDEVRLARAIEDGRSAWQELEAEGGRLPSERRAHLRRLIAECERSTRQFVTANLRLVVSIAKRFRWSGIPLPDLIQEGNIGLIEAVRRFDYRRGHRFSTYAAIWIRQAIGRAVSSTGRAIRLPVHAQRRLAAVRAAELSLADRLGRAPSLDELAAEVALPRSKVAELLDHAATVVSLDTGGSDDDGGGGPLAHLLRDERSAQPFEAAMASLVPKAVDRLLAVLDGRDREVLRLRYGLAGDQPLTTTQIGQRLGVSGERIRQIERRALGRLKPELARMEQEGLVERV